MKKGLTNSLGWLILETQKSRACVELRQISTVLTSLIITMLLCFPVWRHKPCSSFLPNKLQRFFRVLRWWTLCEGVCTFLSFPLRFHSFRLRENASGWSAPKVDSPVLNWRTDPWHRCTCMYGFHARAIQLYTYWIWVKLRRCKIAEHAYII